jgi:hypothetical protein
MKRTCNGCMASWDDQPIYKCRLGYDIDGVEGRPREECPKPRTLKELCRTPHKWEIIAGRKK